MQWSKLKQEIEARFCEQLQGRVQVWSTRYRRAQDQEGRGWITVDGCEIWEGSTFRAWHLEWERARAADPNSRSAWNDAIREDLLRQGVLWWETYYDSLTAFLQMSISAALRSKNPLIRALAVIDRRTGKRRLRALLEQHDGPEPYRTLLALRGSVEGLEQRGDGGSEPESGTHSA